MREVGTPDGGLWAQLVETSVAMPSPDTSTPGDFIDTKNSPQSSAMPNSTSSIFDTIGNPGT